ncbi:MAG: hypothetical protein EBY17_27850 [Acidobacteriia bacterium]|nr:hypothetical protein [Terriglobia bacterium]
MNFLLYHDFPNDLSYLLAQLGYGVTVLRNVLPVDAPDFDAPDDDAPDDDAPDVDAPDERVLLLAHERSWPTNAPGPRTLPGVYNLQSH